MAKKFGPHYEEGLYQVVLGKQYFGETESGSAYLGVYFKVAKKVNQADNSMKDVEKSFERETRIFFTEKTTKFCFDQLKALGWNGSDLTELDPDNPGGFKLEGRKALMWVKHGDFVNEKTKEKGKREEWSPSVPKKSKPKNTNVSGIAQNLQNRFAAILLEQKAQEEKPESEDTNPAQEETQDQNDVRDAFTF